MADLTSEFSPESTRAVLDLACARAGLGAEGARLMRLGENAMYRLASVRVIVRIGRSVDASRKETGVARWLQAHSFPAVRLARVDQPVIVHEMPVTFWEVIEESDEPTTSADLGRMLHDLHSLPAPDFSLPRFTPMPKVERRLANIGNALPPAERQFLSERKRQLEDQYSALQFALGCGPIHGDAHAGNLMRDTHGLVRLIDFEDFCWGPREWDVCVEAVRYKAFGWVSGDEYSAYVNAYGFDPLDWPGFSTIRAMRELNMTTWLAQQLGQSEEVDTEVRKRIKDLRDVQAPRRWGPH